MKFKPQGRALKLYNVGIADGAKDKPKQELAMRGHSSQEASWYDKGHREGCQLREAQKKAN